MLLGKIKQKVVIKARPQQTLTVPITIGTESTVTPTTINIDRDVFLELINNRVENNTEVIRDAIKDSIMSLYARMTYNV